MNLQTPQYTVVIPALNESLAIEHTLTRVKLLADRSGVEVLVVDGGSTDETREIVARCGVPVLTAPRGRGSQMAVGAAAAHGRVLIFVHADTLLPNTALEDIDRALADPSVVGGNFEIQFDGDSAAARFLTWLYRHLAWIGLVYGDSVYFVRHEVYREVGGFRTYPIFEDLDLLRRLKRRGRFVRLPSTVVTSARRFDGRSFALVFLRWTGLQILFWLGVSPNVLVRAYAPIRTPGGDCADG